MRATLSAGSLPLFSFAFLRGPLLLAASIGQLALGNALLSAFPARPFNPIGAVGIVIVMTFALTLIAGLGETGNWLSSAFRQR